ncbi:SelB C-terminal domain-containing protein [bacterium]|nr:SelB C-terminal domain-containing protein [bacterium]
MKTTNFDAMVNFSSQEAQNKGLSPFSVDAPLLFKDQKVPVSFSFYSPKKKRRDDWHFIHVRSSQPLFLKWKDAFELQKPGRREILAQGRVLNPEGEEKGKTKPSGILSFLEQLSGNREQMILALAHKKGIKGVGEKELTSFSSLSPSSLLSCSQELERKGSIKIVRFSPLLLLTQSRFEFLCDKILKRLQQFHRRHPQKVGMRKSQIQSRWKLHPRVLSLAVKHLYRKGRIKEIQDRIALSQFQVSLPEREEKILAELERMCEEGRFKSLSYKELKKHFSISSQKLNDLISILIQRRKIMQGPDGFFIHSPWLDELVRKLKGSTKKEMTVGEFKQMTGLTRKYAIPLLELLDQMGVTRRKGSVREIL